MKIIFEDNKITLTSNHLFKIENDEVLMLPSNKENEYIVNSNTLNLRVSDSLQIEEIYLSGDTKFNLNIDDEKEVSSIILLENENDIYKTIVLNTKNQYTQIVADVYGVGSTMHEEIFIKGERTSCYSKAAVITSKDNKKLDIAVVHEQKNSSSKLDNYGVVIGNGNLLFKINGTINKGCIKSNVLQTNKIILFDKESKGTIEPLLFIDENDVVASHAAAVGKVDDYHIFYLCSRGLDELSAKKEIAKGYLKPVLEYLHDENIRNDIENKLEKEVR